MSWSYSEDPSSSDLDEVRFWLGDTDESDQLLSDEEIQFIIDNWAETTGSNLYAASVAAENVASKFAREVMVSADGVSVSIEMLQQKFNDLAMSLRDQYKARGATGLPAASGTLFNESFDSSIKALSFGKGMHDNIRGGRQDYAGFPPTPPPDFPEDAIS